MVPSIKEFDTKRARWAIAVVTDFQFFFHFSAHSSNVNMPEQGWAGGLAPQ